MYLPNEQRYMYRQVILLLTKSLTKRSKKVVLARKCESCQPKGQAAFQVSFSSSAIESHHKTLLLFFFLFCDFFLLVLKDVLGAAEG